MDRTAQALARPQRPKHAMLDVKTNAAFGKKRAENMTPERRREIAAEAAKARWQVKN